MRTQVLAFDVYGTLLDTSSVAKSLSEQFNLDHKKAEELGKIWRLYQLEYTWRLNSIGYYEPWNIVTHKSLLHALGECGLSSIIPEESKYRGFLNSPTNNSEQIKLKSDIDQVLKKYHSLDSYADAQPTLAALNTLEGVKTMVFSNGTEYMIKTALKAASLDKLLSNSSTIFVADRVKKYKPSYQIYRALLQNVQENHAAPKKVESAEVNNGVDVWLVSGNPFDVIGARAQGIKVIWVDRARNGWTDRLGDNLGGPIPIPNTITTPPMNIGEDELSDLRPTKIVHGLEEIPAVMKDVLVNGIKLGEGGFDRDLLSGKD